MAITVYCYDSAGYYTHSEDADENPLEPGAYLLPPDGTTVAPAQLPARWHGSAWVYDSSALAEHWRCVRNKLLAATDFLLMPDYPLGWFKRRQVKRYRQQLRDLTQEPGYPEHVVLPLCPIFVSKHFNSLNFTHNEHNV